MKLKSALLLCLALASGCRAEGLPDRPVTTAKFGVLFGGQVQQRRDIPFEIDPAKQTHGFVVKFSQPLDQDVPIQWELNKPGSSKRVRDREGRPGRGRLTTLGRAVARTGTRQFERAMHFEPGDPLGLWNIRVVVGDRVAIDRPFVVYDPAARRRALARDAGPT